MLIQGQSFNISCLEPPTTHPRVNSIQKTLSVNIENIKLRNASENILFQRILKDQEDPSYYRAESAAVSVLISFINEESWVSSFQFISRCGRAVEDSYVNYKGGILQFGTETDETSVSKQ